MAKKSKPFITHKDFEDILGLSDRPQKPIKVRLKGKKPFDHYL